MKIKIGVFFGGKSVEHEVSIITAIQAIENIDKNKYEVVPIYISKENKMYCGKYIGEISRYKDIDKLLSKSIQVTLVERKNKVEIIRCNKKLFEKSVYDYIDIAFPIVHGTNVEDGTLQGYLQMLNIPYVGSDVISSACGMDKYVFKCILENEGIPVLDCKCFTLKEYNDDLDKVMLEIENKFGYPVIVKPVNLGSSVGIKIAKDRLELDEAITEAFVYARKILVEKAIVNLREINCSFVGDYDEVAASECEEPIKTEEILSFKDKYISGGKSQGKLANTQSMNSGVLKLPAEISKKEKEQIQEMGKKTFRALGCVGVVRIDFIINLDDGLIYVNEINTIPGSLSFHLWKAKGVEYTDLLEKIISLGLKRNREQKNITYSFESNILADNAFCGTKCMK